MDNVEAVKLAAIIAAVVAVVYLVKKKGAAAAVGAGAGGAIVDLAGGAASGILDGISVSLGIPTTNETLTDTGACRSYMDANGIWSSLGKCGAPAFMRAVDFWPAVSWAPQAVGEVASGALDGISTVIGIPTTKETLTDTDACRSYMAANGVWSSLGKCGAPAFIGALW